MKHHLVIAGTGRAGTTFLVQYLHGCGLETHLTHNPEATLNEPARAGLEDIPIEGRPLPYVIKTPWLYELVDRLLERSDVTLDVVLLPMRDIVEVATSRVTRELSERYASLRDPGVLEECSTWESWGKTRGGVVYSLNPLDQARILAVGFHQLIHALVKRSVPMVFLDFSRMIEDADYLFEQLEPHLAGSINRDAARELHRSLARPDLVRVGAEMHGESASPATPDTTAHFPSFESLDRAALLRELRAAKRARLPLHKRIFRKQKHVR